jgi:hypothetical protein
MPSRRKSESFIGLALVPVEALRRFDAAHLRLAIVSDQVLVNHVAQRRFAGSLARNDRGSKLTSLGAPPCPKSMTVCSDLLSELPTNHKDRTLASFFRGFRWKERNATVSSPDRTDEHNPLPKAISH